MMMSPMLFVVFLVGLVIGHAALALTLLSRSHALPFNPTWLKRLNGFSTLPLILPAAIAVGLAWLILNRRVEDWSWLDLGYALVCNFVTWVILPVDMIARKLRRLPAGVKVHTEPVTLTTPPEGTLGWIGPGRYNWMFRLRGNQALMLQASTCDIELPALPSMFGTLRVLHLSDLHFARCYDRGYFEAVADAAAEWPADLVLFTGDLLDDVKTLEWTVPVLSKLRGRLGQFAILGNHDIIHRPSQIRRAILSAGFTMLDGRWNLIEDGDRTIALGGTSAPWGPSLDPDARPEADVSIVLSHSPDSFPRIAKWGTVDLVLAGHNHGGQIRLPLIGPLVMPSLYGRHFDRGFFRRGRTLMELTQGIGGKHPLRYGCPPEIVRLVLTPSYVASSFFTSRVRRISDSTSRT
jgi:predicted MPP superfamily phosphohydrolase